MDRFRTSLGESLYCRFSCPLRHFLSDNDSEIGLPHSSALDSIFADLQHEELHNAHGPDELFDDLYVLRRYAEFFEHYGQLWRLIVEEKFSASWRKLQDALDALRVVRRFSGIDISLLEDQLVELEKTFPYNVFFSIGAVVAKFECSICGQDIDSLECSHRKGHLYRGRMAVGIARDIVNFDHVSLVDQPEDRRCVVKYEDEGAQFKLVRLLAHLLRERKYAVSDFGQLQFSKRSNPNPEYQKMGRNHTCYCGSGKKFKRCCIAKAYIEGDHVDITPRPLDVERAVL